MRPREYGLLHQNKSCLPKTKSTRIRFICNLPMMNERAGKLNTEITIMMVVARSVTNQWVCTTSWTAMVMNKVYITDWLGVTRALTHTDTDDGLPSRKQSFELACVSLEHTVSQAHSPPSGEVFPFDKPLPWPPPNALATSHTAILILLPNWVGL